MAISPRPPAVAEAVDEIMRTYRSLPPRPTIEEVAAATAVLTSSNCEEEAKIEELSRKGKPAGVPDELFFVLQEVKRNTVQLLALEQRREALRVLDLDRRFRVLDELIQRASKLVSDEDGGEKEDNPKPIVGLGVTMPMIGPSLGTMENDGKGGSDLPKELGRGSSLKSEIPSGKNSEKLSLIMVASLIETYAKKGTGVLDLQGKLMDQIEWLPTSLGKLQDVTELNLSENRIMAIPPTIGSLRFLTKFDIHSNQLTNLPDSIGELSSLVNLDLHGNKLTSLPPSIGNLTNLVNLDLSCNQLSILPETLGNLTNLRRLILETNELEELPFTIGSCLCLVELRLDFNHLKALPEAIGKLESLEILTLHYNRIKSLPTTMTSLYKLRELDASFNELESVPESLCFAINLVKLDIGRNFADLRALPRSIGNLENLEELDISSNQIRVLPDSFRYLSKLRVFLADETPLEVPPREIVKLGAQAVVQYMADLVAAREVIPRPAQKKSFWSWIFAMIFCRPKNKKISVAKS
ncbi:plant intracellular Ras-group-related LRR protein 5-like [Phalaenopsis equestris]|uniref:plant intracellular Ras-group-related LRR protein 5-like n=1 Tax=Phalaenopsis equestris TaxID=78828 RepID=UPI0009E229E8|nr:plant intracellular Ras-group-related LRR protein 5-like [Phalaenopsis equestris]